MKKKPTESKVVVWGTIVFLLTTLGNFVEAIDVHKLPPDVQKWALPVVSAFLVVMRLWKSNIKANP